MKLATVIRTWIWLPALLLVIAVGLGATAANPVASSAGPQGDSAAEVDGAAADGAAADSPEVKERIIDGECELVDADGIPLYDSQFEQRTGSSPCDQD